MTDERLLEDFPLHPVPSRAEEAALDTKPGAVPADPEREAGPAAAPLSPRLAAAAADAAAVLLLTALAILVARLRTGAVPGASGLVWVGVFVVFLSAVATIVPIVAFGRTIGMALADLTARSGGSSGVPAAAAFRRWLGTLATAATGGLLLLWTARDADAPTPADRLSGCALIGD